MARQNIYIGTNDNDGTGDKLRDAMRKVNENFTELYTGTASNTNVSITSNKIEVTNANGNLTLAPNGTGQLIVTTGTTINSGHQPTGYFVVKASDSTDVLRVDPLHKNVGINTTANVAGLNVVGNATITGTQINLLANVYLGEVGNRINFDGKVNSAITPFTNNAFDLGTSENNWSRLYVSNVVASVVNAENATITSRTTTGNITISGESVIGNLVIRGNEISNTVTDEDITINPFGSGNVFVNTKLVVGTGGATLTNPVLQAVSNYEGFTQIGVQNTNGGVRACSDIIATTDTGSDVVHYIDLGINNSGYDGSIQKVYYTTVSGTVSAGDTVTQTNSGTGITVTGTVESVGSDGDGDYLIVVEVSGRYQPTAGTYGNLSDTTSGGSFSVVSAGPDYFGFTIGKALDGYLYVDSGNLTLGTGTADKDVVLHAGGLFEENEIVRVKASDQSVIIGTTFNPASTGERLQVSGKIKVTEEIVQTNRTISSAVGTAGDKVGMIASDNSYFYRCTGNYDGSTHIWKRVTLNSW